ncbi:RidA family protein [Rasiella sp. SM2506]|uniref:RidA family protein n=1 Tax=Rasiella sp. SM2506 TaxID=3423914 RepID=UPI003D7A4AE7
MKIISLALWAFILCCFLGCKEHKEDKEEIISTVTFEKPEAPIFHKSHEPKKQDAPFSDVVQVGNMLYLSGQIGMDHYTRELVEGGIEAETKQAFENIRDVLSVHGLNFKDVVKVTVILDDINDFKAFNDIYIQYLSHKPARTTFAVEALARGAKIEIEVVAVASKQ